jgi:hypothetical protein
MATKKKTTAKKSTAKKSTAQAKKPSAPSVPRAVVKAAGKVGAIEFEHLTRPGGSSSSLRTTTADGKPMKAPDGLDSALRTFAESLVSEEPGDRVRIVLSRRAWTVTVDRPPPEPEPVVRSHGDARLRFWKVLGAVDDDILAPIFSAFLFGGPQWPNREQYRIIRRAKTIVIASDGLSDPWDEKPGVGIGEELFIELPHPTPAQAPINEIMTSKELQLLRNLAHQDLSWGGIAARIDRFHVMSVQLGDDAALIGMTSDIPTHITTDEGPVRLLAVTPILFAELEALMPLGAEARVALASRLEAAGYRHLSIAKRDPV